MNVPVPPSDTQSLPTFTYVAPVYSVFKSILRTAAVLGFDFQAHGLDNIPKRGGVLIVANHQSFLDPAMLGIGIRRPCSFLAKSELFENPVFGGLIRRLNAFPVRQGEGDVGAVRETIKRLQEGHLLTMFPEGGRTEDGEPKPIQGGVGLIVRRAGPNVKVVPAAIHGAYDAWPRHRKFPRCGKVRVKYGPALSLSEMKAAKIVETIGAEIGRLWGELKEQDFGGRACGANERPGRV
jgi:1-acyl-sn-glycerol-3-phosphate acyltransferase